jgi:hypothetical protein
MRVPAAKIAAPGAITAGPGSLIAMVVASGVVARYEHLHSWTGPEP